MRQYLGHGQNTTALREWRGLVCAFCWFFCSMVSGYEPFYTDTWTVLVFMLSLCVGLAGAAFLFGKRPEFERRLLPAVTAAGAACTGLVAFLPTPAGAYLYWLSALMMAPLLQRRLFGVLATTGNGMRTLPYISAVSATTAIHMAWMLLPLPYQVKFPTLILFVMLGLWNAGANTPECKYMNVPQMIDYKEPVQIMRIAVLFILLILLNTFNTLIHANVLAGSLQGDNWLSLAAWAAVPLSFLFFAALSDRGNERMGFITGILMILLGCIIALIPAGGILTAPLLILGEFGGTLTEFYFLTIPLILLPYTRKPRLIAVSGLIIHTLFCSALSWTQDLWLPQAMLQTPPVRPLVIFGALCALALIPTVFSVWRRNDDATLVSSLFILREENSEQAVAELVTACIADTYGAEAPSECVNWLGSLDILESEYRVAMLLCEGLSREQISAQIGIPAAQVNQHLLNIRQKLGGKTAIGRSPAVLNAAKQYGLTGRETEVFNELLLGRTNAEISTNLYIEDSTVKTHIHKILKKTGARNRADLIAKLHAEHG